MNITRSHIVSVNIPETLNSRIFNEVVKYNLQYSVIASSITERTDTVQDHTGL